MLRVYVGAIMAIAGVAALIEASSHHTGAPEFDPRAVGGKVAVTESAAGLSRDAYDLLRIGAWALVILGAVTVVIGVVQMVRRQP
jgi:hypothetical protein